MNKFSITAGVLAAIFLSACGGNPPQYEQQASPSAVSFPSTSPYAQQQDTVVQNITSSPTVGQEVALPTTVVPNQVPVAQPTAKNASALNPAHGEPGHRCDIPVGTPLSTPPQQPQQAQNVQSQVKQVQPIQAAPVAVPQPSSQMFPAQPATGAGAPNTAGKRINPPHGEPGHDCAVPVGQALK